MNIYKCSYSVLVLMLLLQSLILAQIGERYEIMIRGTSSHRQQHYYEREK